MLQAPGADSGAAPGTGTDEFLTLLPAEPSSDMLEAPGAQSDSGSDDYAGTGAAGHVTPQLTTNQRKKQRGRERKAAKAALLQQLSLDAPRSYAGDNAAD
jgi:hypothetical protein